ncbi:MAG: iron ABC transporter permease [Tissierellia bacterium]|nr:iron ABC transporter permease [Tissierellia bacterium]
MFTALATVFFPANFSIMPLAAFSGAFLATITVYLVARKTGASRMTIILAGVAVSSLVGAMTDTVLILFPDTVISRTSFIIGGLAGVTMNKLLIPGIIIFISIKCHEICGSDKYEKQYIFSYANRLVANKD